MDGYSTGEWARYREEVIRLDGGACTLCGKSRDDGAILQVHHKQYLEGVMPWQYPFHFCRTLCKGCHAAEHGHVHPRFGWQLLGQDDLGSRDGACELCGTSIRYVFLVDHKDWLPLEIGSECADNITSTKAASGLLESRVRYGKRLRTFVLSPRWRIMESSGSDMIVHKACQVDILPTGTEFEIRIDWVASHKRYSTLVEAKAKAFEAIESGAFEKYRARLRERVANRFKTPT